jgi:hypothetical protein
MRPLPVVAPHRHGVFTIAEAIAVGWTPERLEGAARRGSILRLRHGLYVSAALLEDDSARGRRAVHRARAVAATLAWNGSAASHNSAAMLDFLPTWKIPELPCLTVAPRTSGDAVGAHLHRATLPDARILRTAGPVRTIPARTVIDIAREKGLDDAICCGDKALRHYLTNREELAEVVAECHRWPGIRRAREALELFDPLSESPLESVSRLRIHQLRIPAPQLQVLITDLSGRPIRRVDEYWDEPGVFGEVDGREKYDENDPDEQWWSERRQFEALEDLGLEGTRWGKSEIDNPRLIRDKLARAFTRARCRPPGPRLWRAVPTEPPTRWQIERESGLWLPAS